MYGLFCVGHDHTCLLCVCAGVFLALPHPTGEGGNLAQGSEGARTHQPDTGGMGSTLAGCSSPLSSFLRFVILVPLTNHGPKLLDRKFQS